jgi:hypothetical protein
MAREFVIRRVAAYIRGSMLWVLSLISFRSSRAGVGEGYELKKLKDAA